MVINAPCLTAILYLDRSFIYGWARAQSLKEDATYMHVTFHGNNHFNTLKPRQHGRHFPDDIFKCIFLNEHVKISIKISLKFVPKGPINIIPALVQIMARRRPGDKPLSEPMMVSLLTHICVTRPQWVNGPTSRHSTQFDEGRYGTRTSTCCRLAVWYTEI